MYFKRLTEENYQIFAMQHYDNQECNSVEDFYEDINRIKYIKRLFRRYVKKDELRERLIINHIVSLSNVFGVEPATRLLFFKIEKELWPVLKTFLVLLSYNDNYRHHRPSILIYSLQSSILLTP